MVMETFVCLKTSSRISDTFGHLNRSRPHPMLRRTKRQAHGESSITHKENNERLSGKQAPQNHRRKHQPRHRYSCHTICYAVRLHVLQAASQTVIGRFLVKSFLCYLFEKYILNKCKKKSNSIETEQKKVW